MTPWPRVRCGGTRGGNERDGDDVDNINDGVARGWRQGGVVVAVAVAEGRRRKSRR
jgi:hypothetical protein